MVVMVAPLDSSLPDGVVTLPGAVAGPIKSVSLGTADPAQRGQRVGLPVHVGLLVEGPAVAGLSGTVWGLWGLLLSEGLGVDVNSLASQFGPKNQGTGRISN